ncbi:MAG: glycoside hydrolase family 9 protein, partial [Chloroflexota bacterium]
MSVKHFHFVPILVVAVVLSGLVSAVNLYRNMSIVDETINPAQHEGIFRDLDSLMFYLNTNDNLNNAGAYSPGIIQINTVPARLTLTSQNTRHTQLSSFDFRTANRWGVKAALPLKIKPEHGLEISFQTSANHTQEMDRNVKLIRLGAKSVDNLWKSPFLFARTLFAEVGHTDIPALWTRPRQQISVNQLGYYTKADKIAAMVSSRRAAVDWALKDGSGQTVLTGKTELMNEDGATGDVVQRINFSAYATPGKEYTLEADGQTSDPFEIGDALYTTLKLDALRYFYLSRSGMELEKQFAGAWARPAGHLSDSKVTCYAGTDSSGKKWPACAYTLDASRGWYDAGDYGKYVVNGGISVWT